MYRVSDELSSSASARLWLSDIAAIQRGWYENERGSKEGKQRASEREKERERERETERRLVAFAAASDVTLGCLAGN